MPFPAQRCSEACHEGCCEAWCEAYCCAEFAAASCYGLLPWSHEKRWTDSALRRSARSVPFSPRLDLRRSFRSRFRLRRNSARVCIH